MTLVVMVGLVLSVGLVSYFDQASVLDHVRRVRASELLDLHRVSITSVGVEVEGYWNDQGWFVAEDIEVKPPRRPRLRGTVQAIDTERREVRLYGIPIRVSKAADNAAAFDTLTVGQRVELSCDVEDAKWHARSIRTSGLKANDKIKGIPSGAALDANPPSIEVHGIKILVEPERAGSALGALGRIEQATELALVLQQCRVDAQRIASAAAGSHDAAVARRRLEGELNRLDEVLAAAYGRSGDPQTIPAESFRRYLDELRTARTRLGEMLVVLDKAMTEAPGDVAGHIARSIEPHLSERMMAVVHAYLALGEEELGDRLRDVAERMERTARVAWIAGLIATVLAVLLGVWFWNTIRRPIDALHGAALRIGQGEFDTRVACGRDDELGVLAEAFNRMAAELERSTVSVAEKELLLRELHHRVKNNLQVVSSLLSMQGRDAPQQVIRSLDESQSRIRTIALIHEQLHRSEELESIDLADYLGMLVNHLVHSYGMPDRVATEVVADDVEMDLDKCFAVGLIVNELVTNSLKHAFPDESTGTIRVTLRPLTGGDVCLEVKDDGVGPPDEVDASDSLGQSLVETLARQLGGDVSRAAGGGTTTRVTIAAEVPEGVIS